MASSDSVNPTSTITTVAANDTSLENGGISEKTTESTEQNLVAENEKGKENGVLSITPTGIDGDVDIEGQAGAQEVNKAEDFSTDWRFWAIFGGLAFTSLLTAIEATVTSTALPTIARALNAQESYVWFVNAFFLTW
jgi:hypothetical protein